MSQCQRVLAVLADGKPHSMLSIHERAGFMRLNSRISELRSRGHVITCDPAGGKYIYQLLVRPGETAAGVADHGVTGSAPLSSEAATASAEAALPVRPQPPHHGEGDVGQLALDVAA